MKHLKKIDSGKYNRDQRRYDKLIQDLYTSYPGGVKLTPEYAFFVDKDLTKFLIRLARYKFVSKMLRATDTILEVGCGSGLGSIFLSQHCSRITGLDIKETEINEAKSITMRKNVEFLLKDLFDLDEQHKYDAVVALDVIEHYSINEARKLILEMSKHMNEKSMLLLGTPSIYSYPYQGKLSQSSHIKCYDQNELVTLMDDYFGRSLVFSMNDELVHTGNPKMAWYYFVISMYPKRKSTNP